MSPEFIQALPAMNAAASQSSDYKALVFLFFNGGMDSVNAVLPQGPQYAQFEIDRTPALCPPPGSVLSLTDTPGCGLSAALPGIRDIYNAGKAAIVCNVGPLRQPLTKAQFGAIFSSGGGLRPYQLFSHSDQQIIWGTDRPDTPNEATGWFGRAADLFNASFNTSQTYPSLLTAGGRARVLEAEDSSNFQLTATTTGAVIPPLSMVSTNGATIFSTTVQKRVADFWVASGRTHKGELSVASVLNNALQFSQAAGAASGAVALTTTFPNTILGRQMHTVARMIRGRATSQHRRQFFFVQLGGFDTHAGPYQSLNSGLLTQVNAAVAAFYAEMVAQGVSDNVTLFTGSDFGRALLPNGTGTDHGWGGHHFVIGGAVQGGRLYNRDTTSGPILNTYPTITLGGPWDGGEGRLIPQISVSEYGATLMRWMGLPDEVSDGVNPMNLVFPLLPNFASRNLGFMA